MFFGQHVYIPVLFIAGVDYIDAPTPYLMGLHSSVDISFSTLDGVCLYGEFLRKLIRNDLLLPIDWDVNLFEFVNVVTIIGVIILKYGI